MPAGGRPPYNGRMQSDVAIDGPQFAVAGALLEAIGARDLDRIARALDTDAKLRALLPRGLREWSGPTEIAGAFDTWFGDAEGLELVDASIGQVGALLQLRWRLRVRAASRGEGPLVVEQHAYAKTGPSGRICDMSLLCSGFWPEHHEP